MNDQPENVIQLGPVKKTSVRPPDPLVGDVKNVDAKPATATDNPDEMLTPYPDNVLLRCSPKPDAKNGEFLVHDGAGQIVAGVKNKNIANLFCCAVHHYIRSAQTAAASAPPEVVAALEAHAKATEPDNKPV